MIPFNVKIYTDLKNDICEGRFKEGEALPTELQLQTRYGVSKAPVRQALGKLENEGLIIRKAGKGTFINPARQWKYIQLGGYSQEFFEKGDQVICKTLSINSVSATQELQEIFLDEALEQLTYIDRYRSIDQQPYQYLEHYFRDISIQALQEAGDIPDMPAFLAEQGLIPLDVKEQIDAVALPKEIAERCGMVPGIPVMKIKRLAYDNTGKVYEYMVYYTDSTKWKYRVQYNRFNVYKEE